MVPGSPTDAQTPSTATKVSRGLTEKMQRIGRTIEKQEMGTPERLALLREQATLSDQREALRSRRYAE
jgi:hypothetical protein